RKPVTNADRKKSDIDDERDNHQTPKLRLPNQKTPPLNKKSKAKEKAGDHHFLFLALSSSDVSSDLTRPSRLGPCSFKASEVYSVPGTSATRKLDILRS